MNTLELWMEYSLEMGYAETIAELNAYEAERNEWAICCEAIEAAEHGLTVSELRSEYEIRARDVAINTIYQGLQMMAMADMRNPS